MSVFGMTSIKGRIVARSPVHQGGSNRHANLTGLNTQKWMIDGKVRDIPFISGNSIRGYLRRLLMEDFLDQIGYKINTDTVEGQKLHHALYTGGVLEKSENIAEPLDLVKKARIYDLLPPVKLFGFTFGSQMVESTLKVCHMLPVCTELRDFLPEDADPKCSVDDLVSTQYGTRRDDLRGLTDTKSNQMIYNHESFIAGTLFYHEFRVEDATSLDRSTMARALALWKGKPYIGGRSASGSGDIQITYDLEDDDSEYLAFCQKRKRDIASMLNSIFTPQPKKAKPVAAVQETPKKRGGQKKSRV